MGGGLDKDITTDIWSCLNYYSHTVLKGLFSLIFCSVARILLMVRFCSLYYRKSFSERVKLSHSLNCNMCGR